MCEGRPNGKWRIRPSGAVKELRQIAVERPNVKVHVRYDAAHADDLSAGRCNSVKLMDADFLRTLLPSNDAEFYFCGPKPFMQCISCELTRRGVDDAKLHYEFFGPKEELSSPV